MSSRRPGGKGGSRHRHAHGSFRKCNPPAAPNRRSASGCVGGKYRSQYPSEPLPHKGWEVVRPPRPPRRIVQDIHFVPEPLDEIFLRPSGCGKHFPCKRTKSFSCLHIRTETGAHSLNVNGKSTP